MRNNVEKIAICGTAAAFLTLLGGKEYFHKRFVQTKAKDSEKNTVVASPIHIPTFLPTPTMRLKPEVYCKYEQTGDTEKEKITSVFFEETGHTLEGNLLKFWRTHKGDEILGKPITEVIEEDGKRSQYFENSKLVFDKNGCVDGNQISVESLGKEVFKDETTSSSARTEKDSKYSRYFPESGHTVKGKLKKYWEKNGGFEIFGYPQSEEFIKDGVTYQLFEKARLEYYPEVEPEFYRKYTASEKIILLYPGEIKLAPLGKMEAERKGIKTSSIARAEGIPVYSSNLWGKRIEVDKTNQRLKLYEGETVVLEAKTSTGLWGGLETPTGDAFDVMEKRREMRMKGPGYDLWPVPWNLYFSSMKNGYFIHGAYWHDDFGMRKSHGCVNLEMDDAKRVYDWANLGTPITIY